MANETRKKDSKKKSNAGSIIILVIIALIVIAIANPSLLFFLNENQKAAVELFRDTYLTPYSPVKTSDGGFDVMRLVALAILFAGCYVASKVLRWLVSKIHFKNRNAATVSGLISNLIKYAIVIYGILFGLSILGVNMGAIIASLGILSLVIGFGAQSLIEDVITGMFIIFEGQLHIDDIVSIDGFRGQVVSIGIRTTQLKDDGGNIKIINNSDIRELINLSDVVTTATVTVEVTNDVEIEFLEKTMNEIMKSTYEKYPELFASEPEYLGINAFVEDGLELLCVGTSTEDSIYSAQRALRREIRLGLQNAGIDDPIGNMRVYTENSNKENEDIKDEQ